MRSYMRAKARPLSFEVQMDRALGHPDRSLVQSSIHGSKIRGGKFPLLLILTLAQTEHDRQAQY